MRIRRATSSDELDGVPGSHDSFDADRRRRSELDREAVVERECLGHDLLLNLSVERQEQLAGVADTLREAGPWPYSRPVWNGNVPAGFSPGADSFRAGPFMKTSIRWSARSPGLPGIPWFARYPGDAQRIRLSSAS